MLGGRPSSADDVRMVGPQLAGVLDQDEPLTRVDQRQQRGEHRRLAGAGAAGDQEGAPRVDDLLQQERAVRRQRARRPPAPAGSSTRPRGTRSEITVPERATGASTAWKRVPSGRRTSACGVASSSRRPAVAASRCASRRTAASSGKDDGGPLQPAAAVDPDLVGRVDQDVGDVRAAAAAPRAVRHRARRGGAGRARRARSRRRPGTRTPAAPRPPGAASARPPSPPAGGVRRRAPRSRPGCSRGVPAALSAEERSGEPRNVVGAHAAASRSRAARAAVPDRQGAEAAVDRGGQSALVRDRGHDRQPGDPFGVRVAQPARAGAPARRGRSRPRSATRRAAAASPGTVAGVTTSRSSHRSTSSASSGAALPGEVEHDEVVAAHRGRQDPPRGRHVEPSSQAGPGQDAEVVAPRHALAQRPRPEPAGGLGQPLPPHAGRRSSMPEKPVEPGPERVGVDQQRRCRAPRATGRARTPASWHPRRRSRPPPRPDGPARPARPRRRARREPALGPSGRSTTDVGAQLHGGAEGGVAGTTHTDDVHTGPSRRREAGDRAGDVGTHQDQVGLAPGRQGRATARHTPRAPTPAAAQSGTTSRRWRGSGGHEEDGHATSVGAGTDARTAA